MRSEGLPRARVVNVGLPRITARWGRRLDNMQGSLEEDLAALLKLRSDDASGALKKYFGDGEDPRDGKMAMEMHLSRWRAGDELRPRKVARVSPLYPPRRRARCVTVLNTKLLDLTARRPRWQLKR